MNASRQSVIGSAPVQFGFTLRDVALCSIPVFALGVSILSLL